jgi:starch-binding outer membrane protein, SusD/RagB family
MKNILKNISFLLFVSGILVAIPSCKEDEFFEFDSPAETTWKTVGDFEYGIAAVYRSFVQENEAGLWVMQPFMHFAMSDIARQIDINGGWSSDRIFDRDTKQRLARSEALYSLGYRTILLSNNVLDFLKTNPFPEATTNDKELNLKRIEGEALFLRAMAYYQLVTWFAPAYDKSGPNSSKVLTLRLTVPRDINSALNNTPISTDSIYQQIVTDLKAAKEKLPLRFLPGMNNAYQFGRASKHAAGAALARVLMLMGKYDEALIELNGVLDDPARSRSLLDDPEKVWLNNSATTAWNDSEIIWYAFYADRIAAQNNRIHPVRLWGFFINFFQQDPIAFNPFWIWSLDRSTILRTGMINPDNTIPSTWTNDKRSKLFYHFNGRNAALTRPVFVTQTNPKFLWRDFSRVGADDPVVMSAKYYRVPTAATVATDAPQNIPIIRSAELYLWRAALKQITGKAGAAMDLNMIRQRSWNTTVSGTYIPLTDAQATFDEIDNEWVKEMAFEGDRIIWLQMLGKPIGPGSRTTAPIIAPYKDFEWQIPLSEVNFRP